MLIKDKIIDDIPDMIIITNKIIATGGYFNNLDQKVSLLSFKYLRYI